MFHLNIVYFSLVVGHVDELFTHSLSMNIMFNVVKNDIRVDIWWHVPTLLWGAISVPLTVVVWDIVVLSSLCHDSNNELLWPWLPIL